MSRARHLIVLTDRQIGLAMAAIDQASEHCGFDAANRSRAIIERQRKCGLNKSELNFAMTEVLRQVRGSTKAVQS